MHLAGIEDFIDHEQLARVEQLAPRYYGLAGRAATNWKDFGSGDLFHLAERISSGEDWRSVVCEFTEHNHWLRKVVLSSVRPLLLDVLNLNDVDYALDLGAGWGQLTRPLADRVKQVVSVETTKKRMDVIHAICEQERRDNVHCLLADALDLPLRNEVFDLVLLCGVFEWLGHSSLDQPVETLQRGALKTLARALKPGGGLAMAIENRTGLKYLFGERDDHSQLRAVSSLPYEEANARHRDLRNNDLRARTYSFDEYRQLFCESGFEEPRFFLAFPDYKLPQVLIPADQPELVAHAVERGILPPEHDGVDGTRSLFNDLIQRAYRALAPQGCLHLLAPSFFIYAKRSHATAH